LLLPIPWLNRAKLEEKRQPLLQEDISDDLSEFEAKQPTKSVILWLFKCVVACLAAWGLFNLCQQAWWHLTAKSRLSCYCGKTPIEAVARGCTYDHLAAAWLPKHCRDDGLLKMFEQIGVENGHNWTYYNYPEMTTELSIEEVSMRGIIFNGTDDAARILEVAGIVYITTDWHMSHCLYLWWKLSRAMLNGTVMSPRYRDEGHVKHCIAAVWDLFKFMPDPQNVTGITGVFMFPDA
jgi:hypothetical protein